MTRKIDIKQEEEADSGKREKESGKATREVGSNRETLQIEEK